MEVERYRVINKCKFDIGVTLENGQNVIIKAGSFQLLKADDIAYIESICAHVKYFAKRWLVACDTKGNEVSLEQLGAYIEEDPHPHLSDEEIQKLLKKPAKQIKAYLEAVEDPFELHAIADVGSKMNLTADKIKVIQEKVPNMDLLVEDEPIK